MEFKSYTKQETIAIMRERMMPLGLVDYGIDDELLAAISEMCGGDARAGLQILRAATKLVESKGLQRVTVEEIKEVSATVRKYRLSYLLSKLNEHQRAIYEILKKHRSIGSGRLYSEYCKATRKPVVDRAYRKQMERMEQLGLAKSVGSGRWKRYEIIS